MEFDADKVRYAAFFCEENIWHLANDLTQRKELSPNAIGCWDYHVVLVDPDNSRVFDLDTRLACPTSTEEYFSATFPDQTRLLADYRTTVRSVPTDEFIKRFSSDRAHMLDADGEPMKPFPPWNAIIGKDPIWLSQYLSVEEVQGSASRTTDLDSYVASIARE